MSAVMGEGLKPLTANRRPTRIPTLRSGVRRSLAVVHPFRKAEQQRKIGSEEQGPLMNPSKARTRGTRQDRYSSEPSSKACTTGMMLCPRWNDGPVTWRVNHRWDHVDIAAFEALPRIPIPLGAGVDEVLWLRRYLAASDLTNGVAELDQPVDTGTESVRIKDHRHPSFSPASEFSCFLTWTMWHGLHRRELVAAPSNTGPCALARMYDFSGGSADQRRSTKRRKAKSKPRQSVSSRSF
jgi:hypothetical protein